MESTDSSAAAGSPQPNLPPGFRFHPTDEELVVHYLKKKASSAPLPVAIIAEVDLYKFDPWELPAKATFGEQEWYFFSPRDRKYPNGARPNRAATSGYWKATGTDKPVLSSVSNQKVGVKKALVFYGGKPPKGIKTNWIMHEYRLADNKVSNKPPGCDLGNKKNSLRLDDWVLCRIYKKSNTHRPMDHDKDDSMDDHHMMMMGHIPPSLMIGSHQNHHSTNNLKLHMHMHHQSMPITSRAANFGAFLEDEPNLFEGLMNNDSLKRTLLQQQQQQPSANHNWSSTATDHHDDAAAASKRFHGEMISNSSNDNGDDDQSIDRISATLLGQLPQTPGPPPPPLHQLGSLGDGVFRNPYHQLPGMNWYS